MQERCQSGNRTGEYESWANNYLLFTLSTEIDEATLPTQPRHVWLDSSIVKNGVWVNQDVVTDYRGNLSAVASTARRCRFKLWTRLTGTQVTWCSECSRHFLIQLSDWLLIPFQSGSGDTISSMTRVDFVMIHSDLLTLVAVVRGAMGR